LAIGTAAAVAIGTGVITSLPASAASGCSVTYTVNAQWPGGFGAHVTIKNLGDPISSWSLAWSYPKGQHVTHAWNATVTQNGSQVTAANVGYNMSVASNTTVSFGFNGSWNGSNPAPTDFALNGVACTGDTTSSPAPTTPQTPAASDPTTPQTPAASDPTTPQTPAASDPTTPRADGVPEDAAWVASGQWDSWTHDGYTLNNDVWGSGAGSQTIWARTGGNWGVVADHPRTSGIKSYPHTGRTLNRKLSSLKSVNSSFNVSVPADGDYETAYDIWANDNAYEVMLWANKKGDVGPIASSYDSHGAVPTSRNVTVGGHTWNVYRGSNGSNAVFSFVRTGDTNSGTIDVLAVLTWLRTQGWWDDVTVGDVQFGFELSGTAGRSSFVSNDFSITSS
jgi:hypothetical protein